jgi:hypothetical protein
MPPKSFAVLLAIAFLLPCDKVLAQPSEKLTASKQSTTFSPEQNQKDEKILTDVANAAAQADSLTNAGVYELLIKSENRSDVQAAVALSGRIDEDRNAESNWEDSIWSIPHSELLPEETIWQHVGTFVMVEGTGATMRQRFPNCTLKPQDCGSTVKDSQKVSYVVQAPLDVKARILVERLRLAIVNYKALRQLRGESSDNIFIVSWNSVWFDARNICCRRRPGEKYLDLVGEEQVCK